MWTAQFYLKNGAVISILCSDIQVQVLAGKIASYTIAGMPDGGPKIVYLDPSDISSIVVLKPFKLPQEEQDDGE